MQSLISAHTVGEYAGANALPASGMLAAAPHLARATAGASGVLGQSVNRLASGVAANPGTAAAGEVLSTVGAGVGAQIARDAAPENAMAEFLAATAGGIAAPVALAVSPTNLARKGVNAARKRLSPEARSKSERKAISDGLRRHMTPEAEANIREAADLQRNIAGYEPSVAEATENPSFIATQRDFEGQLSGPELDRANRRYAANQQAVEKAAIDLAPQSALSPDDAFVEARARPARANRRIDEGLDRVAAQERAQADMIAPGARRAAYGESMRAQIDLERDMVKGQMRNMAGRMGLNDTAKRYAFGPDTKKRLVDAVELRSKLADSKARPSDIVADIEKMDDAVSITDLMELRSRITDDIRTHTARPDGRRKVQYLEALKSELDNVADDIIRAAGDEGTADNMRRFRAAYREQLIEPFEQGAVGRVMSKDLSGAFRIPDEQVAKEFFDGWNQTAAQQYRRVFADAPRARATMEAAALDDLYAHAVVDGVIDPTRLASWTRRKQGVLSEFPEIGARVASLREATDALAHRRAVLMGRRKAVENAYLSRELARLDAPMASTTAEDVIDQAIRNPARMRKLTRSIKSQPAKDALARQVWETTLSQPDPLVYIRRNREALTQALGEHYTKAFRLARAMDKNKLVTPPSGRGMDANPVAAVENVLGTGLNQLSSRIFAVQSGRTSARYALFDVMGRAFRSMSGNQARQTLQAAIYDPEVALDLAQVIETGRLTVPRAERLYTFLVSNGIVASSQDELE